MAVFVNLPADTVLYNILEARMLTRITLEDTLTKDFVNVFHYRRSAGALAPNLAALVTSFEANVNGHFVPLMNVRVDNLGADMRPLDDPLVMPVIAAPTVAAGAITGDPLSAALAVVFKLNTSGRGRSFMGRKHFGGLSESDSDGGDELKAGSITTWAAAGAYLDFDLNDGGTATYTPCVLSSTLSMILGVPPLFTGADIDSVSLNHIFGTMRRRKEKVPA